MIVGPVLHLPAVLEQWHAKGVLPTLHHLEPLRLCLPLIPPCLTKQSGYSQVHHWVVGLDLGHVQLLLLYFAFKPLEGSVEPVMKPSAFCIHNGKQCLHPKHLGLPTACLWLCRYKAALKPLQFTEHKLVSGDFYFDRQCSNSGGMCCALLLLSPHQEFAWLETALLVSSPPLSCLLSRSQRHPQSA